MARIEKARATGRLGGREWPDIIQVPVTTLDALIAQYGVPAFCKIDVEGYELEVFQGLSRPVPALSFEYQPETPESTCEVIDQLMLLGPYEFNWSKSEPLMLELPAWVSAAEIKERIRRISVPRNETFGDVYARLLIARPLA